MRKIVLAAAACAAVALTAGAAAANLPSPIPLPPAVAGYNMGQYEPYPQRGAYVYVGATTALPLTDVTLQGYDGNSQIDVSGTGPGGPDISANAGGYGDAAVNLAYSYEVSGPPDQLVPITISGALDTGMQVPNTLGYAIASIDGSGGVGEQPYAESCEGDFEDCYAETTSFNGVTPFSFDLSIESDTPETITLEAAAETYPAYGSSFASVDPLISIDPSFGNAAGYEVVVGPGTSDGPDGVPITALPEPGAWSLMTGGVAMIGAALRSRARRAPAR